LIYWHHFITKILNSEKLESCQYIEVESQPYTAAAELMQRIRGGGSSSS